MHCKLETLSKAFLEACWLAAAAMIPLFFSISSAQTFEPDKMFVLKFLALFSGAAWLLTRIITARRKSPEPPHSFLRNPLVTPVLALALIYLLSSAFSIVPGLSWWGLYKRAQGSFSFLCYVVLFLILVTELRRPEQLKRLQFVLVLTSIPASAYPILQQMGLDSLPWSSELAGRSSGTMGNPIFLGGYLVMVIPLTVCLLIEAFRSQSHNHERKPGLVLIGSYCVALALQLAALFSTQSRGPAAGLVVAGYVCAFILFVLNRTPKKATPAIPFAAAGLGLVTPLLVIVAGHLFHKLPLGIALAGYILAIAAAATVYFLFWRTPWGRGWFWLTWLTQPLALLLLLAVFPAARISSLIPSSLGRFSQFSGDSISVRTSLWESGIAYIRGGPPAVLPDGTHDPFHFLRRAVGYGPECAWLPINLYAVPSLSRLQSAQTPDRMHSETFDNLLTIGIAGSIAFLIIVWASLFYALRLLGFPCEGNVKRLFLFFTGLGVLAGVAIPWIAGVPHYWSAGAVPGLLAGVLSFVAWNGFRQTHTTFEGNARQVFVFGVLGGLIAHLIETEVGIAVTPTRLYFYLFLALLSVLSVHEFAQQEMPTKARQAKGAQGAQTLLKPYAFSAGIIILVLSWCFTFNSANEQSAWTVFWRSWLSGGWKGIPIPCALLLLALTIGGSIGLMFSERTNLLTPKSDFRKQLFFPGVLLAASWIGVGALSAIFWKASGSSFPVDISAAAESRITFFFVALLFLLIAMAFILRESSPKAMLPTRISEWSMAIGLFFCAAIAINQLVLHPAWADITCRVAEFYRSAGNQTAAAQLYERASGFAPHETAYWRSLGLAQSADRVSDPGQQAKAAATLRHALELNPLDPAVCRTMGTFHMQSAERSSDPAIRVNEIKTALSYLKRATLIAPNFPDAYSEMGGCYFLMGDYETANSFYQKALKISPSHSRTYMFLGEMQYRRGNLEEALRHFRKAASSDVNNIEARKNVGFLLARLGRPEEAIRANLDTLKIAPRDSLVLIRLAVGYFGQNDYGKGLEYARRAYDATPASEKGRLEDFIEKLKAQSN